MGKEMIKAAITIAAVIAEFYVGIIIYGTIIC